MAREVKQPETVEQPASASAPAAAPVAAAPVAAPKGQHMRKVTVDGKELTRKDYILQLAGEGKSRSEITAAIRALSPEHGGDPNFRYQIVFQATKDLPAENYPNLRGGHPKKAVPAPAATPTPAAS